MEQGRGKRIIVVDRLMDALSDVIEERRRQNDTWGEQNHDLTVWMTVLAAAFGELCQAILVARRPPYTESVLTPQIREEATQVAALAVAIVEYLDRHSTETDKPVESPPRSVRVVINGTERRIVLKPSRYWNVHDLVWQALQLEAIDRPGTLQDVSAYEVRSATGTPISHAMSAATYVNLPQPLWVNLRPGIGA